jgi:hypothetical protein
VPTTYAPTNVEQYSSLALNLNGKCVRMTAAGKADAGDPDVITSTDYLITQDYIMHGGIFRAEGHAIGDGFSIRVVDVDGIFPVPGGGGALFPAGTVLLTPYDDWAPHDYIHVETPYPAKLYAGLYLRLSYRNTQTTSVRVALNVPFNKVLF